MDHARVRSDAQHHARLGNLFARAGAAASAAALANSLVYGAAARLIEGGLWVTEGPSSPEPVPLQLGDVLVASGAPVVPAVLVWILLHRYTRSPRGIFLTLSTGALLVSLIPVLTLPVGAASRAALGVMHIVAAALIVGVLWWRSP